jgi:pyrrolidone-carboxylate peptidase
LLGVVLLAVASWVASAVLAAELTVEERRLDRLTGTGIASKTLEALIGAAGPAASTTDEEALSELGGSLWRAAVQAVQSGEIFDDRALYWARLKLMAERKSLGVDADTLAALERASRGMVDRAFGLAGAEGGGPIRVIVTGFDPFHLDRQIEQSNPSGLAALALDGRTLETAAGPAAVQAAVFPVRFADFDDGLVEAFIEPLLASGVDMAITISMGREGFDLERFPGRRRSSQVTDNLNVLTGASPENPLVPALNGSKLSGPEFLEFTLPAAAMIAVGGAFPIRDNRNVATLERGDLEADSLQVLADQTAVRGSGGGYLSNEIAYRTLLANERVLGADDRIPMGHIHTPRLEGFDPDFERKVVTQIEAMLIAAVEAAGG